MEIPREQVYGSPGQRLAWLIHYLKARFNHKSVASVARLCPYIPSGGAIFDIGAHVGFFSKEFCRIHGGTCMVYSFEPVSYTHSILSRVMRAFRNITVENAALSDRSGTQQISIPVKSSGRLGIGLSHFGEEQRRDFITEKVTTMKLDDYVQAHDLHHLDFIKCDVEGAELLVLQGAEKTLQRFKPTIFCEIDEHHTRRLGFHPGQVFSFLMGKGYQASVLDETGRAQPVNEYKKPDDYLFTCR